MRGFGQVGVGWGGAQSLEWNRGQDPPFPLPERAFISEEVASKQRSGRPFITEVQSGG